MSTQQIAPPGAPFQRAVNHYLAGRTAEAETMLAAILHTDPANADALNLLGVLHCQKGELREGERLISRAIAIKPAAGFRVNLARAQLRLGNAKAAEAAARAALKSRPDLAEAASMLGMALAELGRPAEALEALRRAIMLKPDFAGAHHDHGLVLARLGRMDEAIAAFREAARLDPSAFEAHRDLGIALTEQGRLAEAAEALRAAARLRPDLADLQAKLGGILRDLGENEDAKAAFGRALELEPDSFEARWNICVSHLALIYASPEEMGQVRDAYGTGLRALAQWADGRTDLQREAASVGELQPFYLPYQGRNDRELQRLYGELVARFMQASLPQFAERPKMPPPLRGRLRIGIASAFFSRHSNWKIPIRGWVENLSRRDFTLHGYHLGRKVDDVTKLAERSFERFVKGPKKVEEWAKRIREDRLHVLIFPEIGMDGMTLKLAALRLAPVQATSWGHPNTSGLPTIDYFLSSELMEGPEAQEHYAERLVRLPNLSIHYVPPPVAAGRSLRRDELGLEPSSVMYWCCQSLYKYLPQYDDVFPRIATQVADAKFVFIAHKHGHAVTKAFRERLERAFAQRALVASDYCLFLPHMSYDRFCAVAREADVFLDSIGWSGCNSTLECLSFDTPIVTLPLDLMRTRHTAAILAMMEAKEMIASSLDDYVAIAARLGLDQEWRRARSERIAATKHKVMGDLECVRGLEQFLRSAADV